MLPSSAFVFLHALLVVYVSLFGQVRKRLCSPRKETSEKTKVRTQRAWGALTHRTWGGLAARPQDRARLWPPPPLPGLRLSFPGALGKQKFQGLQNQNLYSPYSHSLGESAGLSTARRRASGSCSLQGLLEGSSASHSGLHCARSTSLPCGEHYSFLRSPFNCPSPWQTAARTPGTSGIDPEAADWQVLSMQSYSSLEA